MPALVDKTTLRIRASPSFCAEGGGDPLADMMLVDCAWEIEGQFNGKKQSDDRESQGREKMPAFIASQAGCQ